MHRGQIGSPQLEQVSLVSTFGWLTQVGARFACSVVISPPPSKPTRCATAAWGVAGLE
jgi:hypothetical protein